MDMPTYLSEIEHAASQLFPLIWDEADAVSQLQTRLKSLQESSEREYRDIEHLLQAYGEDEDGLLTMRYYENYFGADKEQHYMSQETEAAILLLTTHRFSIAALSGNILQYAKQGLSLVYRQPENWPNWTAIGTQGFGSVVRHARNQAMHWETPLGKSTVECFAKMAVEVDSVFGEYQQRSLAFEVLSNLGWKTLDDFKGAMQRNS